jgi:hypothetical protein
MLLLPLRFALAAHPLYAACSFTQLPSNVNPWIAAPATENCNAAFIASGTTCNASCATNYIGDGYSFVCSLGAWSANMQQGSPGCMCSSAQHSFGT